MILMTGRGTSGSWEIRGVQLGEAIGATVHAQAPKAKGFRVAVIVKRATEDLLYRLRAVDVPICWDVVDSWPQPAGNYWDEPTCKAWIAGQVDRIKPAGIVAATQAMAKDCKVFGLPVLTLPHHARPKQRINPIREIVQKVGYEGGEQYLGAWKPWLEDACAKRNWQFVCNPSELADLDLVVAMREAIGYAPRHWKSNVKLANAQGSGTPCIVNREAGYVETATGGEIFADTREEVSAALDLLADKKTRQTAAAGLWPPSLAHLAEEYRAWLSKF